MYLGQETTQWSADSNADLYIINKDVVKILFKTATERPVGARSFLHNQHQWNIFRNNFDLASFPLKRIWRSY